MSAFQNCLSSQIDFTICKERKNNCLGKKKKLHNDQNHETLLAYAQLIRPYPPTSPLKDQTLAKC